MGDDALSVGHRCRRPAVVNRTCPHGERQGLTRDPDHVILDVLIVLLQ